jgi:hypothetical protein
MNHLLNQLSSRCDRASGGIRTHDLLITNQLLCQLSYAGLADTLPPAGKNRKYSEATSACNRQTEIACFDFLKQKEIARQCSPSK